MRSLHLSKTEQKEFWALIDCGRKDDCWPWRGGRNGDGYGYFKQRRANRLAFCLVVGKPKHLVLHTCNNRLCCNPRHLYDGTHAQNMGDMSNAGNHDGKNRRGESHPCHKLSTRQILLIRDSVDTGRNLAKKFKVSEATISMIRNRKRRQYE